MQTLVLCSFVGLNGTKYYICKHKHVTNVINSFKITISVFILPKTVFVLEII